MTRSVEEQIHIVTETLYRLGAYGREDARAQAKHIVAALDTAAPKSDAQVAYEAEGLSEKPFYALTTGERSQYERIGAAMRKHIEASK